MHLHQADHHPTCRKYYWKDWFTILLVLTMVTGRVHSQSIVINEIMFHPPMARDDLQFVELLNTTDEVLELAGWRLSGGIDFTFPKGAQIQPKAFQVVAASPLAFASHYQSQALGPFNKSLSHSGERV
ncbi:lamin tail domain-containing protein, partial [bacterium]|nr:lamin tail domain-containing protein [bacterium]